MSAGYAELPHMIRSHRYANRVMPWPEFQAREVIASLRSSLCHVGGLYQLSSTGIAMNLRNRLSVEFGFDQDGLLPADGLQNITKILLDLHAWAATTATGNLRGQALGELRDEMRRVVGGGYPFPAKGVKRGPRVRKPSTCWWDERLESA